MRSKRSTLKVYITGYSSSPDETDDTPDITASGSHTRDGVIATNMLPFGTKVRIPSLFGKKLFVVEDRMHERFNKRMDIWFPEKEDAKNFGIRYAEVEVL
ncbi:MAG: 3D domain-containing protein [Parcubacteria group bacterium]|nr:3D domain-containing protein [Parcubacteria group bacterium]